MLKKKKKIVGGYKEEVAINECLIPSQISFIFLDAF